MLEINRENNKYLSKECKLVIKAAFPEYSLQEMDNWSYDKIMKTTADAERILQLRTGNDYKIEYEIDEAKVKENNKELSMIEYLEKGIDPVVYKSAKFKNNKPLVEHPFIMGINWRDDKLVRKVGEQIHRG